MKTLFIVDDCDTNLAKAEEALEDYFQVMTLPSADRMFSFLEKIKPDLILLDIEMPVMNGFAALEKLKSSPGWADIPVVFLTGTVDNSIQEQSAKLNAAGIITKPFLPEALLESVNRYIGNDIG